MTIAGLTIVNTGHNNGTASIPQGASGARTVNSSWSLMKLWERLTVTTAMRVFGQSM
jgi:hypothetical protein